MMLLFLLVGLAHAATMKPADFEALGCTDAEFEANGRYTGQNIDMNYDASGLETDGGATKLRVQFYVPRRYTEQYRANSFAITFNRHLEATDVDDVELYVDEGTADQSACYSNRYNNYTYCENMVEDLWTIEQNGDNTCISDVHATIDWADVMGTAFHGVEVKDNGGFTEVFLTATVETWTNFDEGNVTNYLGYMTGDQQWTNTESDDNAVNRKGVYNGDGGWRGVGDQHDGNFGPITINDERYTLYQIPFILRFPRTVTVQTSFKVSSPVTVLTGVIGQDVIQVRMEPGAKVFAVLEAVLTTQIQYPYAVRSPDDKTAPMTVVIGDTNAGGADHAGGVEFIEFDDEANCGGVEPAQMCEQTFKIRITPHDDTPCTVEGDYFFEFWAQCQNGGEHGTNGCTLDDLLTGGDIEEQRTSNGYFSKKITIAHQPFCPVLVDEVRVVGDFVVYHDEAFTVPIGADTVYTNDNLFFEATYRTASGKGTNDFTDFEENDFDGDAVGDDKIIDYVRATRVFMDVTLGKNAAGDATDGWDGTNWDDNTDFTPLGGTRIPGTDITGDDITVTQGDGDAAVYQIVLCEEADVAATTVEDTEGTKPTDCFVSRNDIAVDYLDFHKVMKSKENIHGDDNEIDENEVAFEMRMDERIIPLKPLKTDGSTVKITIEAEVYYIGNRQATRRLLQTGFGQQKQTHVMNTLYRVYRRDQLKPCRVGDDEKAVTLALKLTFDDADNMPGATKSFDWANNLGTQLETFLNTRGAISVARMEHCNEKECQTIYYEQKRAKRRLEGKPTHMMVYLKIESKKETAGVVANKLQNYLVDRRSDIHVRVSALVEAEVTYMEVPGCGEQQERASEDQPDKIISQFDPEQDMSSAAALSTLLATLVGLWALL